MNIRSYMAPELLNGEKLFLFFFIIFIIFFYVLDTRQNLISTRLDARFII
jgi:hypothetical protein